MQYGYIHYLEMIREIIFARDRENSQEIHPVFRSEAEEMAKLGLRVGVEPSADSEQLIYRGFIMHNKEQYPQDGRYIQGWNEYNATLCLSQTYPLLEDICIPTFFVKELDQSVEDLIRARGWSEAFIKNEKKSLWDDGELASVWPINSMEELRIKYEQLPYRGLYAVRKFLAPELFYEEERYWVILGKIYHRTGVIPDIVKEAATRLSVLGSHYYSIDAIPNMIVEVNPGESSDRLGANSAELFASWWADALGK